MSYQHQCIDGTPIHFPLSKLVCTGRNYAEHVEELDNSAPTEPLLFVKLSSCVAPVNGGLNLPQERGSVRYEAEIAMLIGKPLLRKPNHGEVLDVISGYTSAPDLTLCEVQAKLKEEGLPWELAKSFDGTGVLSPFVNADQFPDPIDIGIRLTINGEVRQDGSSHDIFNLIIPLIQRVAEHLSLQAGDVALTDTPSGVGPLNSGDELLLELPGASRLETRVL